MQEHSSLNTGQSNLNLMRVGSPVADSLATKEVRQLLQTITKEKVSAKEILHQGRNGKLQVPYMHGVLLISPSQRSKSGRFWRWDVFFCPTVLREVS